MWLSSKWWFTCDQKSKLLMTRLSGVQCQKGSYRFTLLGVSSNLPPTQTMSITLSIWVIWTMQNTFSIIRKEFLCRLFQAMSRQLIWFVALGPQGEESITHKEMIQCFSGCWWVRTATWTLLQETFPHLWTDILSLRILNQAERVSCLGADICNRTDKSEWYYGDCREEVSTTDATIAEWKLLS
jgi:hypothetical protein